MFLLVARPIMLAALLLGGTGGWQCAGAASPATPRVNDNMPANLSENARTGFQAWQKAYPQANLQLSAAEDGMYAVLDGEPLLFQPADGCPTVSPETNVEPPLCAVFNFRYPVGSGGRYPDAGFDPGRIRNQNILKRLYGQNEHEVRNNCVGVDFLGTKLLFNKKHGAADALSRVSSRLQKETAANPQLKDYIFPMAGTFYWRTIQKSERLSAHSFAVAIDLNIEKGIYWLWTPRSAVEALENARQNYPQAIVDAFEAEGFIWGGKWHSYDFMHFEYCPEILLFSSMNSLLQHHTQAVSKQVFSHPLPLPPPAQ